jgi:hypothetical protein
VSGGFLLLPFENRFGDIADVMDLRPVDLRLGFGFMTRRKGRSAAPLQNMHTNPLGFVRLDRAGVRLFFGHANCDQSFQDFPALHLQLAR